LRAGNKPELDPAWPVQAADVRDLPRVEGARTVGFAVPGGLKHYEGVCARVNAWLAYERAKVRASGWQGTLLSDKQDAVGTHYRRNRYYDPSTGRFTQEDPIGLAGGINLYGFAAGDPVGYSDPFGLCPEGRREECQIPLAAVVVSVPRSLSLGEVFAGVTVGAAVIPDAGAAAYLYFLGPEYLRENGPPVINPYVQQDATMYSQAGRGRGGNRAPNAAAHWIMQQYDLNREGQRALHDLITGMDYTLEEIRELAAEVAEQAKYKNNPSNENEQEDDP
jgi:RHS repeat-associated protein